MFQIEKKMFISQDLSNLGKPMIFGSIHFSFFHPEKFGKNMGPIFCVTKLAEKKEPRREHLWLRAIRFITSDENR